MKTQQFLGVYLNFVGVVMHPDEDPHIRIARLKCYGSVYQNLRDQI